MLKKVRLTMEIERSLRDELREDAAERGITIDQLFSRLLQFMGAAVKQQELGRTHIGFVADATKLEAEYLL